MLADGEVGDSLEYVLLRAGGLDVLHQLEGLLNLLVVHVVDDEVEPRLGNHVHQLRKHLEEIERNGGFIVLYTDYNLGLRANPRAPRTPAAEASEGTERNGGVRVAG